MGDIRYTTHYERVRNAGNPIQAIRSLEDEDVVSALAAASRENDPYIANVLATEAHNRIRRAGAITSHIAEGVLGLDHTGRVTFANRAAEATLGWRHEEMVGRDFIDLVGATRPDGTPIPQDECRVTRDVLGNGETVRVEDMVFRREDGTAFPVEYASSPVIREGDVWGAVVIFHDVTERKRFEEALRASEERFRGLLEAAPDAMVITDDEGTIKLVNRQTEHLFGYSREELVGEPVEMLMPERLRDAHVAFREKFVAEDQALSMSMGRDLYGLRKDGTEFPVDTSLSPMRTEEGILVTAAIRDITERKRVEEERDRALRERRNIMEAIPDVIYMLDRAGRLVKWNRNLQEVTGYSDDELMHRPAGAFFREEDRAKVERAVRRAFQEGYAEVEAHLLTKDGRALLYQYTGVPLRDDEGNVIGLTGIGRDLTERVKAERRVEESEERYRSLFEHNPDAVYSFDLDGNFVAANRAAEAITGYSREELLGRSFGPLLPEEERDRVTERFQEAARGRAQRYESRVYRKDGSLAYVDVTNTPILVEGEVVGVHGVAKDVTERRKQEHLFRGLLESAPDAMIIADERGRIILANRQAELLFGYEDEEFERLTVEDLVPERLREVHEAHREDYVDDPHTRPMGAGLDLYGRKKDGSEFPVEISLSPMQTEEGLLVTAAIRDVRERERAEAEGRHLRPPGWRQEPGSP